MSSAAPLMLRLVSASVAAGNRAGKIIRDVMKAGHLGIVDKGGNDPQTEADRKAQRCIITSLSTRFPGINIYGEETLEPSEEDQQLIESGEDDRVLSETCPPEFSTLQEKDVIVWVDPLDGTKEFTQGIHEAVTVLIGISVGGKPVAGIIHVPFVSLPNGQIGRTIWGLKGLGTRGIDIPQTTPPVAGAGAEGLKLVVTRSHGSNLVDDTVKALNPSETLKAGGCGNKILMVIKREVDVYLYPSQGTKKWDSCAGDAIVRAAGGLLTDVHGRDIDYADYTHPMNMGGLVVTMHSTMHQTIIDKIPENVKKALGTV